MVNSFKIFMDLLKRITHNGTNIEYKTTINSKNA
jgi:hypothetical protein